MSPESFHPRALVVLARRYAARARREDRDQVGASAIEWAIIAAAVVLVALLVAKVVQGAV